MSGRNEIAMNNASSQEIKLHVLRIRTNYNYPAWFENTLDWANEGKITSKQLYQSFDDLSKRGLATLKTGTPTPTTPTTPTTPQSFEFLYPKQTQQLIKIGQDTTALGEIVTRQDATDAGFRSELDQALLGREANQANITSNTSKIEELFSSQQNIFDSIGQKADKSHTHPHKHKNGDEKDCGWFGEKCWFPDPDDWEIPTWLKLLGAAIGIGLLLWLIRPLLKIGANVTK
jgi:membrane-bound lytic murein transglycosylase B